jgi:kynurenine formamidase
LQREAFLGLGACHRGCRDVWRRPRRWLELGRAVRLHREEICETKDASLIWEGHKAGRHIGYCHIEKLNNLEQLLSTGFMVSCFPVKIERASAGWTRAVAILDG